MSDTGLAILADLEASGNITPVGLTITDADIPWDQLEAMARMFGRLHRTSQWLIGDLMNFVEKVRGETYAQLADATGLAPQTLMNYCSIAKSVPIHRRRLDLPFTVHGEVAKLRPSEQRQWLAEAAKNEWSRSRLRDELAAVDTPAGKVLPPPAPAPQTLAEAASDVLKRAKMMGDPGWYMVPRDAITRLRAAFDG